MSQAPRPGEGSNYSSVPPRGGGVPIFALRPSPVRLRHAQVQSQAELLEPLVRVRAEALQ